LQLSFSIWAGSEDSVHGAGAWTKRVPP
jgi:hypothetical protein